MAHYGSQGQAPPSIPFFHKTFFSSFACVAWGELPVITNKVNGWIKIATYCRCEHGRELLFIYNPAMTLSQGTWWQRREWFNLPHTIIKYWSCAFCYRILWFLFSWLQIIYRLVHWVGLSHSGFCGITQMYLKERNVIYGCTSYQLMDILKNLYRLIFWKSSIPRQTINKKMQQTDFILAVFLHN